jgi:hypothetical protein
MEHDTPVMDVPTKVVCGSMTAIHSFTRGEANVNSVFVATVEATLKALSAYVIVMGFLGTHLPGGATLLACAGAIIIDTAATIQNRYRIKARPS